ncbi:MAG: hypothetical protein GXP47_04195 [Acidobacteria bacterium]|nr:hypothetical protein [Acidobacteriota bacterium]
MPHLDLAGWQPLETMAQAFEPSVERWGRAVLKTSGWWRRHDGLALLVEGVIVEYSRPLHPVAFIGKHHEDTAVRLWPTVPVERTRAVQRWLALLASRLQEQGLGPVIRTNLQPEILERLDLSIGDGVI